MRFKVQMLVKNNTRRLSRRSDIARRQADVMTDLFRETVGLNTSASVLPGLRWSKFKDNQCSEGITEVGEDVE